jgi:hypothetical protein
MAENGIPTSPQKSAGQQPEPNEEYWPCSRHPDMKDGAGPLHASLKINGLKNEFFCGPCGGGGGPWQLVAFLSGEPWQWASMSEADLKPIKAKVAAWLRAHGLLAELPEKNKRSRKGRDVAYPVLREYIRRGWQPTPQIYSLGDDPGDPSFPVIAKLIRFDVPPEKKQDRFRWFHPATQKGVGGETEWAPGSPAINELPLYLGQPSPKDEATFITCRERFRESLEVVFLEGEHDADAAAEIGLAAATSGGTSSLEILRRNLAEFTGKSVSIVQHPGIQEQLFSEQSAALLSRVGREVRIIRAGELWPGLAVKDLANVTEGMRAEGFHPETILHLFETARAQAPLWKPAEGAKVLDGLYNFIRRFVSLREAQARVLALWIVHTHTFQVAATTPYLHVFSPAELCGKSQLLEVLELLAQDALMVSGGTASYFRRRIAQDPPPSLLLDEIENLFQGNPEILAQIRGFINSGYRKSGRWGQSEKVNGVWVPMEISTFCPKVIAGVISPHISGTIRSRALPIRLDRKVGDLADWDNEEFKGEGQLLYRQVSAWAQTIMEQVAQAPRIVLMELTDRQKQMGRQLFAICELAGGVWAKEGPKAFIELCQEAQKQTVTLQLQFLESLLDVFFPLDEDGRPTETIQEASSSIIGFRLAEMDGKPFSRMPGTHKPINQSEIGHLAGMFETRDGMDNPCKIQSKTIRFPDGSRGKGYRLEQFTDAWERYCPMLYLEHYPLQKLVTPGTAGVKMPCQAIPLEIKALIEPGTPGTSVTPQGYVDIHEKRFFFCGLKVEDTDNPYKDNTIAENIPLRPLIWGMGRAGTPIVGGRETTMLDLGGVERRPASIERVEHTMRPMGGIERRGKP